MDIGSGVIGLHHDLVRRLDQIEADTGAWDDGVDSAIAELEEQAVARLQDGDAAAVAALEAGLRARRKRGDPCAEGAIDAVMRLAAVRDALGEGEEVVRLVRELDALLVATHGADDGRRLSVLPALTSALTDEAERVEVAAEVHRLAKLHRDPDDLDLVAAICGHAEALFVAERGEEAGALWSDALASYRRIQGEDSEDALDIEANLAVVQKVLGDVEGALDTERRIMAYREAKGGRDDEAWLGAAHNVVVSLEMAGQGPEAERLGAEVFARRLRVCGPFSPDTRMTGGFLMAKFRERGDEEAQRHLQEQLMEALKAEMAKD